MKLSAFKELVQSVDDLRFELPNGEFVPKHFHVTEVGYITKNFIDCGGTVREEKVVNLQLWYSTDYDHKLVPQRLMDIIKLSEEKLNIGDFEIEVEYQSDTIGKYGMDFNGKNFMLTSKMTDCLAPSKCEVPQEKVKLDLSNLVAGSNSCTPGSGCC